jgi:hypothetical protein
MYFFENISAAVRIQHGKADELVSMSWSVTTCERLTLL